MDADTRQHVGNKPAHRGYQIPELVVGCGDHSDDIIDQIDHWISALDAERKQVGYLKRVSRQSQQDFGHNGMNAGMRMALTAYTELELEKKLIQIRKMIKEHPKTPFSFPAAGLFYGRGAPLGRTAFLFPGQGAQYLGMGGPMADVFPTARRIWNGLGSTRFGDKSVQEVVFPENIMDETSAREAFLRLSGADWTNPGIAVVGESIYALLTGMGLHPDAVAAHSFGDISAFRCAGILDSEKMLDAIRYRGELGVACPLATRGCILIVMASAEKIQEILDANGIDDVWIANYNTLRQTVLSGVKESVRRAHKILDDEDIGNQLIPISAAPHCPLAVDVAEKFFRYLKGLTFRPADCDVYSFLFGRKVNNDPDLFRKLLKTHCEKPVRFFSQVEQMYADGIRIFVEIGPSDILTRLVGQILEDKPHLALSTDHRKGNEALLVFLNTLANLYKEGLLHNLHPLWEGYNTPAQDIGADNTGTKMTTRDSETKNRLKKLDMEFARIEQAHPLARAV